MPEPHLTAWRRHPKPAWRLPDGALYAQGESWRIVYGLVVFNDEDERLKAEHAGCCIVPETREYPTTGKVEYGTPKWACQNEDCRHRWW